MVKIQSTISSSWLRSFTLAAADHGDGICMTDVAYPSYFGAGAEFHAGYCDSRQFRVLNKED
jgi:L-fucose mutarotase/ribose pyranase (RbsD/FucU family)